MEPKVMVYIPYHSYMNYIRECLDSVVSQSYKNQEIILADNASSDGIEELLKTAYPTVKLIKYDTYNEIANPGVNDALKMTDATYFTTLGSDDRLAENYWEQTLPYFTSPDVAVVRVGCYQFSEKNPEGSWWKPFHFNGPTDILIQNKIFITSPSRVVAWREAGDVDTNCFFSDWDMWIRILLNGWKWTTLMKPMFWYRRHPMAWSVNYDTRINGPAYTYMRDKWLPTLKKFGITGSSMATQQQIEEYKP